MQQARREQRERDAEERREQKQRERAQRAAGKAEEAAARRRQERAAIAGRGAPPPLRRDFRLHPELLPDLLMVWDFLQVGCRPRTQDACRFCAETWCMRLVLNHDRMSESWHAAATFVRKLAISVVKCRRGPLKYWCRLISCALLHAQTFCNMLALPPFPFWRLEAAVAPGPPVDAEAPAAAAVSGAISEPLAAKDSHAGASSPAADDDVAAASCRIRDREVPQCLWHIM